MGTHWNQGPESLSVKDGEFVCRVEGKHNELVAKEEKKWQTGPRGTVMEMNVRPVKHFGVSNEERTGDDWPQDKQPRSVVVVWLKVPDIVQGAGVIWQCIWHFSKTHSFAFGARKLMRGSMSLSGSRTGNRRKELGFARTSLKNDLQRPLKVTNCHFISHLFNPYKTQSVWKPICQLCGFGARSFLGREQLQE